MTAGSSPVKGPETPTKKPKRRALPDSTPPAPASATAHDVEKDGSAKNSFGDIKDLEILYGLWKGAGKSVNLWDWFQGYLGSFSTEDDHDEEGDGEVGVDEGDEPARISLLRKRKRALELEAEADTNADDDAARESLGSNGKDREGEGERDVEKRDRLHASFVRFCEEARMLGMVRARGKGVGRRADEVVKGVTLV